MAELVQSTITDGDIDAAMSRGRIAETNEPRAIKVRYHRSRAIIIVDLNNACSFAFPPRLGQGLEEATDDELADVTILGAGYGLHWEALDVDLSVQGLLAGIFGTRTHMARLAGRVSSPAKSMAARANGSKGGRPRKLAST